MMQLMRNKNFQIMSHEEFCQEIYSRLFDLIPTNSKKSIDPSPEQSNLFISIQYYHIENHSQLSFFRRRRLK